MVKPKPETHDHSGDPAAPGAQAEAGQPDGAAALVSEEIAQLQKERDDLRDQVLRARAEFANYQRRARQQADADRIYAVGNLARDLLDSLDNLERAAQALRATSVEGISSGLEMVQRQLLETLSKYGVEPIDALGESFDPNFHEAIMQRPSADHPEGTVVAEFGTGYKIHERVLRPSKVAVSVGPS
jgi:molecular chaperone GrpE